MIGSPPLLARLFQIKEHVTMMAQADDQPGNRPDNREVENENLRPGRNGEAPRPATEPRGARASQNSGRTATDPGSGEAD